MAKGAAPSQDQLLELMKRAAEELKHAQEEARTAVLALQKEQAAHQKTELELEQAQKQAKGAKSQQSTDEELLKDQIAAERENAKALEARVRELEAALEGAASEREALKTKLGEAETALSVASQNDEAKHEKAIAALKETHEKVLEELRKEMEAAETEHKGLLDDAAGGLVNMEQQLNQEKEKHQATAQKLIETRGKVRDLESSLAEQTERVKGLETVAAQMGEAHQKALREAAEGHTKATADLQAAYGAAQQELVSVTARWREVEHQYEALHREMLLTLEQRDEARRMLENERAERERLTKVLQSHPR